MNNKCLCIMTASSLLIGSCASAGSKTPEIPEEYRVWMEELKAEMLNRGISQKTLDVVYSSNYYQPDSEVVKKDRQQPEFLLNSTTYINQLVSAQRVEEGREKYKQLQKTLKPIEAKYGVPSSYIIAFWGLETGYGKSFGKHNVIASLTSLSYDKRRPKFFREQLYQTLKIVDDWNVDYTKMEGSWAGAMGHFQFMPSTFNSYAVDYNQDGQIDIWHDYEDAAASAANYLSSIGWNNSLPWGTEISLPWNFDFSQTGRTQKKTIAEWKKQNVLMKNGKKLSFPHTAEAAIITPEGWKGKAYLVFSNFDKIMQWNHSENYALAIGTLSDYIANHKHWQAIDSNPSLRLKTEDVKTIQNFINKLGWFTLDEDGQLGSKTREAVKRVQKEARLPQDGYPDEKLLKKIRDYNPEIGFSIPVPERKLHNVN